ncbi:MAG: transglycosylase SLT domain-containing protein [Alphaproteobacteria bacterium]|nr:transglycosylase SLT domain-containing protein [Alphaproteobacteria bacterium]
MNINRLIIVVGLIWVVLGTAFPTQTHASSPLQVIKQTENKSETARIVEALRLADRGNWQAAHAKARGLASSHAKSLIQWLAISGGEGGSSFSQVTAFIKAHSDWPFQGKLKLQAEKVLTDNEPDLQVIEWFRRFPPLTGAGMTRYAKALKGRGQDKELRRVLNEWWQNSDLTREQQKAFFAEYGTLLNRSSHLKRLEHLLERKSYANALAIARLLEQGGRQGAGYVVLVQAHQALTQDLGNVDAKVEAVPVSLKNHASLLLARIQWRRKKDLNAGAIALLRKAPQVRDMKSPKAWWTERHILARRLMEEKKYEQAYKLVAAHRQKEGFPMAQAQWMSGWLALRFVNKPWRAFEHFEKLYKNVKSPISRSRGAYWSGRASEALGHSDVARQWYSVAAQYNQTYYGQLAVEKLGRPHQIYPSTTYPVSMNAQQGFANSGLVKAAYWLHKAGMDKEADIFLLRLLSASETVEEVKLLADLSNALKRRAVTIKAANKAMNDFGLNLVSYLYPTIPSSYGGSQYVERSLVHGVIRQESRFDENVVSPAGARGLMQLMPATAKEVARKKGLSHQTSWLTSRPSHNIRLGSSYMKKLLDRFDGHYALAVAAYNAGPNRVARWLGEFGDPRSNEVDLIDWVESLPIYETRNYVQRVLEATYVYRHVLKEPYRGGQSQLHLAAK